LSRSKSDRKGILFVIAAPSGSGKSTICEQLVKSDGNLSFSISFTSRRPRDGEKDGIHYYFVSPEEFHKKIDDGDFLEWAQYADNFYGTDKLKSIEALQDGHDLLLDIEVQGSWHIKRRIPETVVRIFVLPPSRKELERRLLTRGKNTQAELQKRIAIATEELEEAKNFEYLVLNDSLEDAVSQIQTIIEAERHRSSRNKAMLDKVLRSFKEHI